MASKALDDAPRRNNILPFNGSPLKSVSWIIPSAKPVSPIPNKTCSSASGFAISTPLTSSNLSLLLSTVVKSAPPPCPRKLVPASA